MNNEWYKSLGEQIHNWPQDASLNCAEMFQIELGLYLLQTLGDLPIVGLPLILKGHASNRSVNHASQIALARNRISQYAREPIWEDAIQNYSELPAAFRGYHIDLDDKDASPRLTKPSICAGRYEIYAKTLTSPLIGKREPTRLAPAGRYAFDFQSKEVIRTANVNIPAGMLVNLPPLATYELPNRIKRESIQLSLNELRETADWMDGMEKDVTEYPPGNWKKRLSEARLQLKVFNEEDELVSTDKFKIDEIFHLIGMVSAGKSALMEVIAVHFARQGRHITLIVNDVISALDKARQFNGLQPGLAAPVLGKSGIHTHIAKLQAAVASEKEQMPWTAHHSGFRSVSLSCPLMSLRDRGEPDEWVEPRDYPCENHLYQKKQNQKRQYITCPLFAACPHQRAQRELVNAPIWIATPESLVYTSAPEVLAPKDFPEGRLYFARLVYHLSDLIIVDEVDTIQQRLDDIFSNSADLQTWFIKIKKANDEPSVEQKFDLLPDHVLRNNDVSEMSRRLPQMIDLLKRPENKSYRRNYFSDVTLFAQIAQELSCGKIQEAQRLREIFDEFIDDPRSSENEAVGQLSRIAAWMGAGSQRDVMRERREIKNWIQQNVATEIVVELDPLKLSKVVEEMRLALVTTSAQSIFNRLRYMSDEQRNVASLLGSPSFYRTIVPSAPMGNVLAFLYGQNSLNDPAGLSVIDCRGVGRWLLLNFPRLFLGDGVSGPNMLLLSGTSWAGTSPDFDVQCPVNGILIAHDKEVNAIRESDFRFHFVRDELGKPIAISGISNADERQAALVKMVRRMGQSNGLLETELRALSSDRRRVVLFTGSYPETIPIFHALNTIDRWKPVLDNYKVLRLIKDEDADDAPGTIRRGRVQSLAQTGAEILIAPLGAIERGHNILNSKHEAAIGLAIFLVRSHPPPDDLKYALHTMNRWAIQEFAKHEQMELRDVVRAKDMFEIAARKRWWSLLRKQLIYSRLDDDDHIALTWSLLVRIYQVIGRLVRGGVSAKVIFCDAKFLPKTVKQENDDPKSSLLLALRYVLEPYLNSDSSKSRREQQIVQSLYGAMYPPIERMLDSLPRSNTP